MSFYNSAPNKHATATMPTLIGVSVEFSLQHLHAGRYMKPIKLNHMERKEVNAVLYDDIIEFFQKVNLYDEFINKKIICECCKQPITKENLALIKFNERYLFICDNLECIDSLEE